ncbi:MAG: hypothetical protein IQL11_09200 [Bacteroidales bacterium]|nr:hypothetical protein [Bacteroidales bacterium]
MRYKLLLLSLVTSLAYGQLSTEEARKLFHSYKLGSYDYHEQFVGYKGYGAPFILTSDGGAAFFGGTEDTTGSFGLVVKLDREGREEWKQAIRPQFDDIETQSVAQDNSGNFYVFMLSYDNKKYRGGCERIVYLNKNGTVVWDKIIGVCGLLNNPTIAYIRSLDDGRIALRGHVATRKPGQGKDPEYHYWEGWIEPKGKLIQKTGGMIDWANQDWEKLFEPEKEAAGR